MTEVWALAVRDTELFAGTWNGVYMTMNGGTKWSAINSGLTDTTVSALAMIGTSLFAGTRGGVFLRNNNDTTWSAVNQGLKNQVVDALAVIPASGTAGGACLFAGTRGGGVWMRPLSEMITSVAPKAGILPHEFLLQQNYPNPFNSSSDIRYQISEFRYVRLAVYDILGREVAMLVNERKAPGSYDVRFDASGLASGVYLYRLMAGEFIQTRKMIMLK